MPALPHKVTITAAGEVAGVQDDDTGSFEPDASDPNTVYDGRGNFLDQGAVVEREAGSGIPTLQSDGQIVLPKKSVGKFGIKDGMAVTVTYKNGDTVDMSILRAVRFTDILYVVRA